MRHFVRQSIKSGELGALLSANKKRENSEINSKIFE